jgi:Uma2 family endonuclease
MQRDGTPWHPPRQSDALPAGRIFFLLQSFCTGKALGWVAPEGTSYQCFADDPHRVRKPDTSFIKLNRLTLAQATTEGHMRVVPDLVVEVVSPRDTYEKVEQETEEWVSAGVPLVWTVNPKARTVRVLKANQPEVMLRENDEVDAGDALPGFRCRVAEFFATPLAAT